MYDVRIVLKETDEYGIRVINIFIRPYNGNYFYGYEENKGNIITKDDLIYRLRDLARSPHLRLISVYYGRIELTSISELISFIE